MAKDASSGGSQSQAASTSKDRAPIRSPTTSVPPILLPVALVLVAGVSLLKLASLIRNRGLGGGGKGGSDRSSGSGNKANGSLVEELFGHALEEARGGKPRQGVSVEAEEDDGDEEFQEAEGDVEGEEEDDEEEEWEEGDEEEEEEEEEKSSWNHSLLAELKAANAQMKRPTEGDEAS